MDNSQEVGAGFVLVLCSEDVPASLGLCCFRLCRGVNDALPSGML